MIKRALDLYCACRSVVRREAIQTMQEGCDDLDWTRISFRKNINASFAILHECGYDSRCRAQAPEGNRRVWYCFFCFSISLSEAGLNDQFHGGGAIRVQFTIQASLAFWNCLFYYCH